MIFGCHLGLSGIIFPCTCTSESRHGLLGGFLRLPSGDPSASRAPERPAQRFLRGPQTPPQWHPKRPHELPRRAQRCPRELPRASRDHPENLQGLLLGHPRRPLSTAPARAKVDMAFGVVLQGSPNGLRASKNSHGSSEVLPRSPKGFQSLPKRPQGSPKATPRVPKDPPDPPIATEGFQLYAKVSICSPVSPLAQSKPLLSVQVSAKMTFGCRLSPLVDYFSLHLHGWKLALPSRWFCEAHLWRPTSFQGHP